MVIGIQDVKNVLAYYVNGDDFKSSAVQGVVLAESEHGDFVLGCSWSQGEYYWYEVDEQVINDVESVINNRESIGSYLSSSITPSYHEFGIEELIEQDIKDKICSTQKTSESGLLFADAFSTFIQAYQGKGAYCD